MTVQAAIIESFKIYDRYFQNKYLSYILFFFTGLLAGASAPGIRIGELGFGFLIWVCLTPYFALIFTGFKKAAGLGFIFACGYNLVYLNWYLGLYSLSWLGIDQSFSNAIPVIGLLFEVIHQSLIMTIALILSKLSLKLNNKLNELYLIVVPVVFTSIYNLLNSYNFLGVPWTAFEYTQYQSQLTILPVKLFSGKALMGLIIFANLGLAGLIKNFYLEFQQNGDCLSKGLNKENLRLTYFILGGVILWHIIGCYELTFNDLDNYKEVVNIAIIQPNLSVEERYQERIPFTTIFTTNIKLINQCRNALVILPENATPTNLFLNKAISIAYKLLCYKNNLKIVTGALFKDQVNHKIFNSAYSIDNAGLNGQIYHKRYLVPFGEFNPDFVNWLPKPLQEITTTPAGADFSPGQMSTSLSLGKIKVTVLICFEILYPELTQNFRDCPIIVSLSDLSWFHDSIIGEQMLSFACIRAVENYKYVIFAANTGPSAIISPTGKILAKTAINQRLIIQQSIRVKKD